jgi:hypothetical protein
MSDQNGDQDDFFAQALDDTAEAAAEFFKEALPKNLSMFLPNALSPEFYESQGFQVSGESGVENDGVLGRTITIEQVFLSIDSDLSMEKNPAATQSLPEALAMFWKAATEQPQNTVELLERVAYAGWESALDGNTVSRRMILSDLFERAADAEQQEPEFHIYTVAGKTAETMQDAQPNMIRVAGSTLIH